MKESIRQRLEKLADRFEEVGRLLTSAEIAGGSSQFRDLSVEYSRLQPLAERVRLYHGLERELIAARELQGDADAGMRTLGDEEVVRLERRLEAQEQELRKLLLPSDPRDERSIFLEIRAGTGGDEAAIFAGELYRMYARYAESKGLAAEVLSESAGEHGGFKEIISRIAGRGAFSRLKFESGTHRVQRVPATEAQGRIHTSTCTVAILPEQDEVDEVQINPAELRIDTYRSSGAGGQHVTRPTPPCASPTCRAGSWWSARTSARSTRTARVPWRCSRRGCWRRSRKNNRARRRSRGGCRWAAAIVPSASALITSRRAGSPITAST